MLVHCPNCAAGYNVPDHLLDGAGRKLRCAKCAQEWQAMKPAAIVTPEPEPSYTPDVSFESSFDSDDSYPNDDQTGIQDDSFPQLRLRERPLPTSSPPASGARLALAAWVVSVCVLGIFGWSLLHWQESLIHAWPPSERAFLLLGLDH